MKPLPCSLWKRNLLPNSDPDRTEKVFFWQILFCPPWLTNRLSEHTDHAKYKDLCFCSKNRIVWSLLLGLLCFLHSCSAVKAPIQSNKTQFSSLLCFWRLKLIFPSSKEKVSPVLLHSHSRKPMNSVWNSNVNSGLQPLTRNSLH